MSRSTHAHDASRRAVHVRMYTCALHIRMGDVEQVSKLKKDYGWIERKSEHNLYLACEDSPQRAFFFALFVVLFWLLLYIDFVTFSFCVANRQLHSALDSTKHVSVTDTYVHT